MNNKTIIITIEEMKRIMLAYFKNSDVIDNIYCDDCGKKNGKCLCENDVCPFQDSEDVYIHFIEKVFSNYMIPFS